MQIDKEMIKALKDRTAAGLLDCKRALEEAKGDIEKAILILKEKGLTLFEKRQGRISSEFRYFVTTINDNNPRAGVLLTLSETDFASNNQDYIDTFQNIVNETVQASRSTIEDIYNEKIVFLSAQLNENLKIDSYTYYPAENGDFFVYYLHKGKNLSLIRFQNSKNPISSELMEALKKIAVHIVGNTPKYLSKASVSAEDLETLQKELEANINKDLPLATQEKMLRGQIEKRLKEQILLTQDFAFDEKLTVEKYLESVNSTFNTNLNIKEFFFLGNE